MRLLGSCLAWLHLVEHTLPLVFSSKKRGLKRFGLGHSRSPQADATHAPMGPWACGSVHLTDRALAQSAVNRLQRNWFGHFTGISRESAL
jgi:hypothetical protein